jgi:hypothetical protein
MGAWGNCWEGTTVSRDRKLSTNAVGGISTYLVGCCCGRDTDDRREDDVTTAVATPLSAADRCDRCGAQAYIRVSLPTGGELLFCAHHGREHESKLREIAVDIQDETERLGKINPSDN